MKFLLFLAVDRGVRVQVLSLNPVLDEGSVRLCEWHMGDMTIPDNGRRGRVVPNAKLTHPLVQLCHHVRRDISCPIQLRGL